MNTSSSLNHLSLIIEPEGLLSIINRDNLLIIDLCNPQQYQSGHIPTATHVSPSEIVSGEAPIPGNLPSIERLNVLFNRIGLTADTHVIVYDDDGGGWAGRFIWTLDVIGHKNYSFLNGGIFAWHKAGFELTQEIPQLTPTLNNVRLCSTPIMTKEEISQKLNDKDFIVWDARSADEYTGLRPTALRNGHMPNAIHCEWTELMDHNNNLRIRSDAKEYLAGKGIDHTKTIVTHCHSHHRSGFTYLVGKSLGFKITAYPGSWGEWGNDSNTMIECA